MNILKIKNSERKIFRELRGKSSIIDRKKVEKNVSLYVNSYFKQRKQSKYIGIYWPLQNEVDIRFLRDKYSLALPRCTENKELIFCKWDKTKLTKDIQGILAPDSSNRLSFNQISLIFVPCLAIDKNFIRLGYGGGYFDRLREDKNWRDIPCVGLLTSNCVSNNCLKRADWDIPLSGFITEKEILV